MEWNRSFIKEILGGKESDSTLTTLVDLKKAKQIGSGQYMYGRLPENPKM